MLRPWIKQTTLKTNNSQPKKETNTMSYDLVRELPFGTKVNGKKNGAFVAITAKSKLYQYYGDPKVDSNQIVDVCIGVHRWDGLQGLIGGFCDGDETLERTATREVKEEINLEIAENQLVPLATHELYRVVVHAFHVDLGYVDVKDLQKMVTQMSHAEHLIAEGTPIMIHLKTYDKWGKGLKKTLASNTLASAVKEELEILIAKLGIPVEFVEKE